MHGETKWRVFTARYAQSSYITQILFLFISWISYFGTPVLNLLHVNILAP